MDTFFGFIVFIVVVVLASSIRIVKQSDVYLTQFLGKYHRTLTPGINFLYPFVEVVAHKIDLRTVVLDTHPQPVITKDNVGMSVSTVVFYKVTDPVKSVYEIEDVQFAILNICATTLRDVIGGLELDDTYTSRDQINQKLRDELDKATDLWGVRVERVEVKDINPPNDIREAMEKQMRAERNKRAQILEAEGTKEKEILDAQGKKEAVILDAQASSESQILKAHGEFEAIKILAAAEAERIKVVYGALNDANISSELLTLESINALSKIAESDNKMLVPYESSALLGAFEALNKKQ